MSSRLTFHPFHPSECSRVSYGAFCHLVTQIGEFIVTQEKSDSIDLEIFEASFNEVR